VKGIEPSCPAWEAGVLPLNYTRKQTFDFKCPIADWQPAQLPKIKRRPTPDIFHRHFSPVLRLFPNILQMHPRDTLVV
jgi:hypothetical protein